MQRRETTRNRKFIGIVEDNGMVMNVSKEFLLFTGYIKEDFLGKSMDEVGKRLKLQEKFSHVDQKNKYFIFTKDCKARKVAIFLRKDPDTKLKTYTFLEESNSRIEEKFMYLEHLCRFNTIATAIYSTPDLILLEASQKYLDFFDPPYNVRAEALGLRIYEFANYWNEARVFWESAIQLGREYHFKEYQKSGERYWDSVFTPIFENGVLRYYIVSAAEVTERVVYRQNVDRQADIVKQKKEELESVIENISDGLFTVDREYNITLLNKAARALFYQPESIKSVKDSLEHTQYFNEEGKEYGLYDLPSVKILSGEKVNSIKVTAVRPDITKHFEVSGSPLYDAKGEIYSALVCTRDVTEQVIADHLIKSQQEEMLKAEIQKKENLERTLRRKNELFSFISHEFKTPLTVIIAAVQAIETLYKDELSDKVKAHIHKIRQNAFRQLRLANNILDISKAEAGYLEVRKNIVDIVSITSAIMESVRIFASQKGVNLEYSFVKKKKMILLDDEKYERILLNLLSNAIKFTPAGKAIYVNISCRERFLCITVRDEGIGIPEDNINLIFERFVQVKSEYTKSSGGTGLGLTLVKQLVEVLGGRISVESKEGNGSTFTVILPLEQVLSGRAEQQRTEFSDNRMLQSVTVEFSDLYI